MKIRPVGQADGETEGWMDRYDAAVSF